MNTWIVVVVLVIIVLLLLLVFNRIQIKSIEKQLRGIIEDPDTNWLVRIDSFGFGIKDLVLQINELLKHERSRKIDLHKEKKSIQKQMTHISHDLRTPLTSIIGYLELSSKTRDTSQREKYLDIALRRSQDLQDLINRIYELSRIEDQDYKYDLALLSVHTILEDVVLSFFEPFNKKGIDMQVSIDSTPKIVGARNELVRVYSNIMQNILQHGGACASVHHYEEKDKIITVFENDILNVENLNIEHIFDRFYSADPSRGQFGGGLGLYIAQVFLGNMGYAIRSEIEDRRIRFIITYPKKIRKSDKIN